MFEIFTKLPNKNEILKTPYTHKLCGDFDKDNLLIFDDNLNAMRFLLQEKGYKSKVVLVYIDPPFATNNTFKMGSTMSAARDSKNKQRIF